MIRTQFLRMKDFHRYHDWLTERTPESLAMYFGIATSPAFIQSVIDGILSNPEEHYFLVALMGDKWVGVIHMARISEHQMEFGIMVDEQHRGEGIADELMREALVWIQNRGFDTLYLHCLNRNSAMKHLAVKYGLQLHEDHGDVDAEVELPPPSLLSYIAEAAICQKNIFLLNLNQAWNPFRELHG